MDNESADERRADDSAAPAPARRKQSIFVRVLIGLLALVAALFALIATRPSDFRVSRSATMAAAPADVFAQVNDFHQWDAWSPWIELDPDATVRYEGPAAGEGARFYWTGDANVGEGSMTIIESKPDERVRIQLDFIRPFAGTSEAEFTFEPVASNETKVTWSMSGKNNFIAKAIGLVIDCDKMIGENFEKGLAGIKAIVEKSS